VCGITLISMGAGTHGFVKLGFKLANSNHQYTFFDD
jgi:hypothetical protein